MWKVLWWHGGRTNTLVLKSNFVLFFRDYSMSSASYDISFITITINLLA